jgi:hypothetical protein
MSNYTYSQLTDNQKSVLTHCCVASLKEKARLMIDAYKTIVMPRLSEIDNVQKKIEWTDDEGNAFVAVLDFKAKFDGKLVLPDNKTSNNPYRDYGADCVRTSFQLAAYCAQTGVPHGAYIVLDKKIKKNRIKTCVKCSKVCVNNRLRSCDVELDKGRCAGDFMETVLPEAGITIVIDEIPKEQIMMAQDALTGVANAVKANAFPPNLKACSKMYGEKEVKCPYYNYCRNGSMAGLKKDDRK